MSKNFGLLEETFQRCAGSPDYDQMFYRCGTAKCFAGMVAEVTGARWAFPYLENPVTNAPIARAHYESVIAPDTGNMVHVAEYARRMLGLEWPEAYRLFEADNSLADIRRMIDGFYPAINVTDSIVEDEIPQDIPRPVALVDA